MIRRRIIAVGTATLIGVGLALSGAEMASANSVSTYCQAHLNDVAWGSGQPNQIGYCQMQQAASLFGYTGTIDGVMGTNSWKGIQTLVQGWGYTGPVDGAPGTNTYKAMQRAAASTGYTGPIDGAMGTNSWKYWILYIEEVA